MQRKRGMVIIYMGIVFRETLSTNMTVTTINTERNAHTNDAIINPLLIGGRGVLVPHPLYIGIGIGMGT